MKRKHYSEEQIINILKEHEADLSAKGVIRKHGIAHSTFHRWKSKFGGMEVSDAKRLKDVETENSPLARTVWVNIKSRKAPTCRNPDFAPKQTTTRKKELRNLKVQNFYSHLNGMEHLAVNYPNLWQTIVDTISEIDADSVRTKVSKEKATKGKKLIAPKELNTLIDLGLRNRGWTSPKRVNYLYSSDPQTNRDLLQKPYEEQKKYAKENDLEVIQGFTEADFLHDRVALEIQFGKYSFVQYDIFAKHAANYMANLIDVGIEIVPMHTMYKNMSSGPSYYERNLNEILRQGRVFPPVPLILAGISE